MADGAIGGFGALGRLGRRTVLRLALGFTVVMTASAHAPYGQWNIYRKRNLLILTSRSDPPSFSIGQRVAAVLATHLPESRAQVSRAPDSDRVASLISTKQMDVAVLSLDAAAQLFTGRAPYQDYGPVPLRAIVALGDYLLICRDDFSPSHAYLLAETVMENRRELDLAVSSPDAARASAKAAVPTHRGAQAYFQGRPLPED